MNEIPATAPATAAAHVSATPVPAGTPLPAPVSAAPPRVLLLWDIDGTLLLSGGFGRRVIDEVYRAEFGEEPPRGVRFAGRTDRAIVTDHLGARGTDPAVLEAFLVRFRAVAARRGATFLQDGGQVLPGAREALERFAARDDAVQSLLTGNLAAAARIKLTESGLADLVDFGAGAYGDEHVVRADLVPVAQKAAAAEYGADFSGPATVLIGDTPNDVAAALAHGARVVGVATGEYTADELRTAGAGHVLPDLRDTDALAAALGLE